MTLTNIKTILSSLDRLAFQLPDERLVPEHFHVTEVGVVEKHFVDCGGTERKEQKINFQLWSADDYNHRLHPEKLLHIINIAEKQLNLPNAEIEVEYQGDTIGKYHLGFSNGMFQLISTATDCLAKDDCGIPKEKPRVKLSALQATGDCDPNSGCC